MISNPKVMAGAIQDPRPRWGARKPARGALLLGLEQIRQTIQERLDQIEALALERVDGTPAEAAPSDRERALQLRIAELEQTKGQIQDEVNRREQQWQAALEQLENDRRLLSEAWERLERERIDAANVRGRSAHPAAHRPVRMTPPDSTPTALSDSVTQAILRQFQALRSDVRSKSQEQLPHC